MRNRLSIKFIKWYQRTFSAKREFPKCKHVPSCSNYALGCYEKFNFITATFYTTKRVLGCNKFAKMKYDPVPLTKKERLVKMTELNDEDKK